VGLIILLMIVEITQILICSIKIEVQVKAIVHLKEQDKKNKDKLMK